MFYITVRQSPMYKQMTLEDLLYGTDDGSATTLLNSNISNTHTYERDHIRESMVRAINIPRLISILRRFNESTAALRDVPRRTLYHSFAIPKASGGLRRIDAPLPELMEALRQLKRIFEDDFGALYHTSAFAYVKKRSTIDAVKRHQANESKWFGKYDLSNFFGSTTLEFVMQMFSMVFPFSEVIKDPAGREELEKAIELAFLNKGLPQGTPISPLITNVMMIPIDHNLSKALRNFENQSFVYTRYADDFLISSKYDFDPGKIENLIISILSEYQAPFRIKKEKTRYGSSSGKNWNLGIMLNKDNQITVGHKNKRHFKLMLSTYVKDKENGIRWDLHDIQTMEGYRNYYRMVEGETIDRIVDHISQKYNVDVVRMIKEDLKS